MNEERKWIELWKVRDNQKEVGMPVCVWKFW